MSKVWQTQMNYDSWTDADLYRAIDVDPACAQDYIGELTNRRVARARQLALEARVNAAYGIGGKPGWIGWVRNYILGQRPKEGAPHDEAS